MGPFKLRRLLRAMMGSAWSCWLCLGIYVEVVAQAAFAGTIQLQVQAVQQ